MRKPLFLFGIEFCKNMCYNCMGKEVIVLHKKINNLLFLLCFIIAAIILCGCQNTSEPDDTAVWLKMNTEYEISNTLPDGNGEKVKVILLLGQSNATGCSINEYLKKYVGEEKYSEYENGFSNILINYMMRAGQ